jgi:hypothetical protein
VCLLHPSHDLFLTFTLLFCLFVFFCALQGHARRSPMHRGLCPSPPLSCRLPPFPLPRPRPALCVLAESGEEDSLGETDAIRAMERTAKAKARQAHTESMHTQIRTHASSSLLRPVSPSVPPVVRRRRPLHRSGRRHSAAQTQRYSPAEHRTLTLGLCLPSHRRQSASPSFPPSSASPVLCTVCPLPSCLVPLCSRRPVRRRGSRQRRGTVTGEGKGDNTARHESARRQPTDASATANAATIRDSEPTSSRFRRRSCSCVRSEASSQRRRRDTRQRRRSHKGR